MISNGEYMELVCALSDDKHYFKEPILLTECGHAICKRCIPEVNQTIKCKICGVETNRNLKNDKESIGLKKYIQNSIENLMLILENQTTLKVNKLKNYLKLSNETIELNFNYILEEIEIRIESLKIQLDDLNEHFKSLLDDFKKQALNFEKKKFDEFEIYHNNENFESILEELRSDIEKKLYKNEDKFYTYQDNLIKLNAIVEKLDRNKFQLSFKPSIENLEEKFIGELFISHNELKPQSIINILQNSTFNTIQMSSKPYDLCVLPNGHLLTSSFFDKCLTIYDENFNFIKNIDKIDNKHFRPSEVILKNNNQLYISNYDNHQIMLMDLNFQVLKIFQFDAGAVQMKTLSCMCYGNNQLYVSDISKKIHILSDDLEYKRSVNFTFKPWKLKVLNKTLCISSWDSGTYFYDLDNCIVKKKIDFYPCRISLISSCFSIYHQQSNKIYFHDENGDLINTLELSRFNNFQTDHDDGCLIRFNSILLLAFNHQKHIAQFSLNQLDI